LWERLSSRDLGMTILTPEGILAESLFFTVY
jgi:hypothetical protein